MLQIVGYRQKAVIHCVPCAHFDFSYGEADAIAFEATAHEWGRHVLRKEKAHEITSTDEGWEQERCDQCLCKLSDPVKSWGGAHFG
jgi:hypothetical protein